MTPARLTYFLSLTPPQARRVKRDATEALRFAWPHRDGRRARLVIASNVATLRDLREVQGL